MTVIEINARRLGTWGEELARHHYEILGYECLEHSWRGSGGEIDLILEKDGEVVFAEVKTRSSARFGVPAAAVDHHKRQKIRATSLEWLTQRDIGYSDMRFDVVSVDADGEVEVLEGCF